MKTYVFQVDVVKETDGRFAATCPALPGCATWGHTQEEALRNIREAVEAYVEDLVRAGEPVPGAKEIIQAPAVSVVTA
ncbi:MAG: type II toxin-antitoxin system HicB family antitoxin [Planctomycetes bacterium]|nr:type II toxin-antitoxin system HicB family antitoxin [Planctomycetota bacterium]